MNKPGMEGRDKTVKSCGPYLPTNAYIWNLDTNAYIWNLERW